MGSKLRIHPGVFLLAAMWLLVLPPMWGLGVLLAALVHEVGHLLAVLACGGQVVSLCLDPLGARINTTPLSPGREAVCALAGPLGSFTMLLISRNFPEAALCGLIQGVYNMLPILPLDGGRILHCLLPEAVTKGVEAFFLTFLTGLGLWLGLYNRELGLIFTLFLWIPVIQRKFSCKAHE